MVTQDVFTRGQTLMTTMVQKITNITKGRRSAIVEILLLYISCRGRVNFLQFGRQGSRYEKTYRYHYEKEFDWSSLNSMLIKEYCTSDLVIGFDPSYISKSGKHTPGLGSFYSGVAGGYKKGLEIGGLAIIDVNQNTAYHYESVNTPNNYSDKNKGKTIVDHYAGLIIERSEKLEHLSTILAVDGYFAKKKFVDAICEKTNLEIICRLRDDANLRYILNEPIKGKRGRPKEYDGKVDLKNIDKTKFKKEYENEDVRLYGLILNSVGLKRNIKVCIAEFLGKDGGVRTQKIFFSTKLERNTIEIYKYYKARFQMEFIFRDAKQYTGLDQCQARSEKKLNFHFNASMTAINMAKCILRNDVDKNISIPLSIGDLKLKFQNRNMLYRIFSIYALDHKLIKMDEDYDNILKYGNIAA